jgi:hypothetical protein
MPITIRRARAADAAQCGTILYTAFQRLADEHSFARDFPSAEVATGLVSMLLANLVSTASWQKRTAELSAAISRTTAH